MSKFVNNPLWEELQSFIENTYQTKAMLNYSRCSGRRGWNLKYRKSGKSLCVLDPMDGYFFVAGCLGSRKRASSCALLDLHQIRLSHHDDLIAQRSHF